MVVLFSLGLFNKELNNLEPQTAILLISGHREQNYLALDNCARQNVGEIQIYVAYLVTYNNKPKKTRQGFFFSCKRSLEVGSLERVVLWFHGVISDLGSLSFWPLFSRSPSCPRQLLEAQPSCPSLHSRKEERERKEEEGLDPFILRKLLGSSTQRFHLYLSGQNLTCQGGGEIQSFNRAYFSPE